MAKNIQISELDFANIKSNIKTFEIRRCNRDYKIKDILILENLKTKEVIKKEIKYINDLSIYNIDNILILGI